LALAVCEYASAHLPELLDLWVESWSEVYDGIDFNARRGWFKDHLTAWIEAGNPVRIAVNAADGSMAGFIFIDTNTGLLDQICVARAGKGSGTATLLMTEARRLSPAGVTLSVNAMNARAIRFYEREGFVKTGEGVNPRSGLPILHYRWQP
jgi:putative acetyltransferase